MKSKIYIVFGVLCMLACLTTSCKDEPYVDNPSGETFIYKLSIANGGLTGTEVIAGTVDETSKAVNFTIPAETDIQSIKFDKKLSLGAHLDKDSYDFSQSATQDVTVVNGENTGVYHVTVTLNAPKDTPMISSLKVKAADGTEKEAYVSEVDKTLYLGCESSKTVEIESITCMPRRTVVTYTAAANGVISQDNPGKVKLDFMGITNEYRILFDSTPVFGADFKLGTTYDFTAGGGNIFADFAAENTRSADFDGNQALIVSREGGLNPKVLTFDEIKSGKPTGTALNVTGISGGTYLISAGRLSHSHIYICNLTTKVAADNTLKVYHWANAGAAPEVVLEFSGDASGKDLSGIRLGDNISVNLDDSGNGTMFFVTQDGTQMVRFDVTGFTKVSNPTFIVPPVSASYYAAVNAVPGTTNEFIYTSITAPIILMDREGTALYKMNVESIPVRCTDARIVTFDSERYLIATTGRQGTWSGDAVQTFYVYDLSAGATTALALTNFEQGAKTPLFTFSLGGKGCSAPAASTGAGTVDGVLRMFTAAPRSGFAVFEFPEKK